jgi:mannitol-1-phosphate 5-dehydrogenase
MRAVVFGAGRLGCGLVGQVLRAHGYELDLVARNPALAEHLTRVGGYRVRLSDGASAREIEVSGVRCLPLADRAGLARAVARADLVTTTVGLAGLPGVADVLSAGCDARGAAPLNVLTFENGIDPAGRLARLLRVGRPAAVGVAGVMAERIVSRRLGDPAGDRPLTFVADPACGFVVDAGRLVAPLPALPGMRLTRDFRAWVDRKLSLFSAGHAATAYLGALKGYLYIHAAVRDRQIRAAAAAVMYEGQAGLAARYGAGFAGGPAEVARLLGRYANATLDDPVRRVGRDPLRKLAPGERIIGTAVRAEEAGLRPDGLALVAAAALCYLRRAGGFQPVDEILTRVCGLSPDRGLGARVRTAYRDLRPGGLPDNPLLDVDRRLWATTLNPSATANRRL